jgi:hypothetical protein
LRHDREPAPAVSRLILAVCFRLGENAMQPSLVSLMLAAFLLAAAPASSQQPETGPKSSPQGHPLRTPETGTRGPSGASPETGYHGPRDVTKDAEPGKAKSAKELRRTGAN